MSKRAQHAWLSVAVLLGLGVCAVAHAVNYGGVDDFEQYGQRVHAAEQVSPESDNTFGDSVSLYNGATTFEVTDISLPGNDALPVALQRRLPIQDLRMVPGGGDTLHGFGDWDFGVPYIDGTFTQQNGWTLYPSGTSNRCSDNTDQPYTYLGATYGYAPYASIWDDNHLHIPGGGDQALLANTQSKSPAYASRGTYKWVTTGNWKLSCIASVSNLAGEGFVAVSPSGVSYTFNWAVTRQSSNYAWQYRVGVQPAQVPRVHIYLLATHVQDRFGNWVNYAYGGTHKDQLTGITSSDGRSITINWSGSTIANVTSALGTWIYGYVTVNGYPQLTSVTRPDGSQWTYSVVSGSLTTTKNDWPADDNPPANHCQLAPLQNTGSFVYKIGTPSGASATFTLSYDRHYRDSVPFGCQNDPNPNHNYPIGVTDFFDNFTLESKQVSGPALVTQTWSYNYGRTNGSYYTASAPWNNNNNAQPYIPPGTCANCQTTNTVTVTGPTNIVKSTFGTTYARTEAQLLDTEVDDLSLNPLKTATNAYVSETQAPNEPFPNIAGQDILPSYQNPMGNRNRPVTSTQIAQDGATFTSTVNTFDSFARATSETAASSLGFSKTATTAYSDNLTKWVLGQVASSTVNGILASQTTYDSTTALPLKSYSFGKLISTKAWNADGTLASITDGNSHGTTLSSWYRGIPRTVTYADGKTQSATVNTAGWITAVTDENGYATGYGYDAMGRLASIAYPSGDDVAWNATTRVFQQIGSTEYGIPAGHWKQTVHTGNGYAVTYFDALWRPLVIDTYDSGNVAPTRSVSVKRYDAGGRAIFASYPMASLSSYTAPNTGAHNYYDALDRTTEVDQDSELGLLKTKTAYLAGFKTQVTDPRDYSTTTSYLAFDAPSTDAPVSIASPESETTTITRDIFGKPLTLTRSGPYGGTTLTMTRNYVYDANMQLCKRIDPESGSTVMAYDLAGNLQWSAAGLNLPSTTTCDTSTAYASGRRADRTYDARNHLLTLTFPDHRGDQTWSYTADGLPARATTYTPNGGHTFINTYTYDKRRLLTGETLGQTGWYTWPIGYAYDANGHLSSEYLQSGVTYTYSPNALGQTTQIATSGIPAYVSAISYFPDGKVQGFTYGNGIVHTMSENTRLLPARSTFAGAQGQPASFDSLYTYDGDADVTAISDVARTNFDRTMAYDGLDRVSDVYGSLFPGGHHYVYAYDPLDNIRSLNRGNVQITNYGYDTNNRLTTATDNVAGTTSYSYDVQGNLAIRNGVQYQFDYGNRLREIPTEEYEYGYDAYGRRVVQLADSGGILSQYNSAGQLTHVENGRGGPMEDDLYLNGALVGRHLWNWNGSGWTDAGMQYQTTDVQDTVVAHSNSAAWVDRFNYYDPYGTLLSASGPVIDGPGYAGQVSDQFTNLSYAQQRYYDPSVGRFLSMDPVDANTVTGSNFNRYIYANDNPYRFTDPDGRNGIDDDKIQKKLKDDQRRNQRRLITGSNIPGNSAGGELKVIQIASPSKQQMALSKQGLQFIERHEGYANKAYNDSAGNPTIGYGHLIQNGDDFGNGITNVQAGELLTQDAGLAASTVNDKVTTTLSQSQFDALVDFTYNVGGRNFGRSMLLNNINAGKEATEGNFTDWNHAGGEVVNGLTTRRIDEFNLYSSGNYGGQ